MVARYIGESVGKKGNVKSTRVKWVEYALRSLDEGVALVSEAWDLGEQLKRVKRRIIEEELEAVKRKGMEESLHSGQQENGSRMRREDTHDRVNDVRDRSRDGRTARTVDSFNHGEYRSSLGSMSNHDHYQPLRQPKSRLGPYALI